MSLRVSEVVQEKVCMHAIGATTSGQARGLLGDAGRSNAHGYRFGCALEQPAAWSWRLRVVTVLVAHDAVLGIARGRSRFQGTQRSKRAHQSSVKRQS